MTRPLLLALRWVLPAFHRKHKWRAEGGRACPKFARNLSCSQTVYRCSICGAWDYGDEGGPAYDECAKCEEEDTE